MNSRTIAAICCFTFMFALPLIAGAQDSQEPPVETEEPAEAEPPVESEPAEPEPEPESESESESEPEPEPEPVEPAEPVEVEPEEAPVDDVEVAADVEEVAYEEAADDTTEEDPEYRVDTRLITPEKLAKIGGAAQRIDEKELKQLQYDDASQIATSVPSVYARGEDGFGLRPNIGIRGANSDRSKKVTLMEDGILFGPAPYSAPAAYYFPIASRMVGVEIYKGPGAVEYGPNTIGGAMNWVTRDIPYFLSGGVDANFGSYLTGKGHAWLGASTEWGGFVVEGIHWQSDGFKELDGGGDTGFNRQEFMAKGRLNTSFDAKVYHQLDLKLGFSRELSNETYLGLTDADFDDNPYRRYVSSEKDLMDWWRTQAELFYTMEVGDTFKLDAAAYRHDFYRSWFKVNGFQGGPPLFDILQDPTNGVNQVFYDVLTGEQDSASAAETLNLGDNQRRFVSQGVQVVASHKFDAETWSNNAKVGVRAHYDQIERDHTEDGFLMQNGRLVSDGSDQRTTTQNTGKTTAIAAWVTDQFSFWQLTFAGGVRTEIISATLDDELAGTSVTNDQFVLIPGLGVHWEFLPHLGAIAGVHRGFSPVSPGQPDEVEPETSVNYEAGLRYADSENERLIELIGFFNDYNNLLGECTFSAGCDATDLDSQFNGGEVDVFGLEAMATWTFPLFGDFKLPVRAAYTFATSEFKSGFVSDNPQYGTVEEGDELPYLPKHRGSLRLTVTNDIFRITANGSYTAKMREEASQGDDALFTDDYFILDVIAGYTIIEDLEVYAKAENLTMNEAIASRRPFGARPIKPFMVQGGVRWNFEIR